MKAFAFAVEAARTAFYFTNAVVADLTLVPSTGETNSDQISTELMNAQKWTGWSTKDGLDIQNIDEIE